MCVCVCACKPNLCVFCWLDPCWDHWSILSWGPDLRTLIIQCVKGSEVLRTWLKTFEADRGVQGLVRIQYKNRSCCGSHMCACAATCLTLILSSQSKHTQPVLIPLTSLTLPKSPLLCLFNLRCVDCSPDQIHGNKYTLFNGRWWILSCGSSCVTRLFSGYFYWGLSVTSFQSPPIKIHDSTIPSLQILSLHSVFFGLSFFPFHKIFTCFMSSPFHYLLLIVFHFLCPVAEVCVVSESTILIHDLHRAWGMEV